MFWSKSYINILTYMKRMHEKLKNELRSTNNFHLMIRDVVKQHKRHFNNGQFFLNWKWHLVSYTNHNIRIIHEHLNIRTWNDIVYAHPYLNTNLISVPFNEVRWQYETIWIRFNRYDIISRIFILLLYFLDKK